ncbi:pilus assembly protein TadG [Nostoc sp. 3335mG]|nr:pilus assembly protein TadG [Nostoc sp. 3335mG]
MPYVLCTKLNACRLCVNERGAATIEFALCAAGFLALLIGTLQIAVVFFVQNVVQTAAEKAAREVLTGQVPSGTTQSQFRARVCSDLPAFLNCSNLYVDVRKLTDLSGVGSVDAGVTVNAAGQITDATRFELGGAGDIVVLRLLYHWQIGTAPLGLRLNNQEGDTRIISGTMAFKAEPYA